MVRLLRLGRRLRRINSHLASGVMIALAVVAASHLPEKTAFATAGIILLMAVLGTASLWGWSAGLISSVFASLAYDFFFFPPIYSFEIDDWRNALSVLIFGLACAAVCLLAERLRERARAARHREIITKRLQTMSQHILKANSAGAIAEIAAKSIGVALGAKTFLLLRLGSSDVTAVHPRNARLSESELAEVSRPDHQRRLGNPMVHDGLTCSSLPLDGRPKKSAVLIVGKTTRRIRRPSDRARTMDLFAAQAAAALERIALTNEIQETRVAAETEKLRSALLTAISHDLKTPLSIILGAASSLSTLRSSLSVDATQYLLKSILDEGQRLDQFIANLLDMSQVESEAVRPKRQPVDLQDVVGSALHRAERLLSGHAVVVLVPDGLPMVELDPVLMEKVLFNILENAAKYTPEGSRVTVSAVDQGNVISVSIADEGPGIPEGEAEQLFEKFRRIETKSWQPAGTGLGLAICRGFLQAMGGSISASNRSDARGAVFTIKLPVAPAAVQPLPPAALTEFRPAHIVMNSLG